MLTRYETTTLLKQIINGHHAQRKQALQTLYTADEGAVTPLIDEFYAGVNETTGLLIITVLSDIGGYEANQLFEDIITFPQPYQSWFWAAEQAINTPI